MAGICRCDDNGQVGIVVQKQCGWKRLRLSRGSPAVGVVDAWCLGREINGWPVGEEHRVGGGRRRGKSRDFLVLGFPAGCGSAREES
jgi:hypothetical protein